MEKKMIKCPYCENEEGTTIHQHDSSLAGYRDYGREFTCLLCKKDFYMGENDADESMITKWPDV